MSVERLLGRQVGHPITATELDLIDCPANVAAITFKTSELTATCGVTGQPDIYEAHISYRPGRKALESKALKHYLWGFRDQQIFAEDLASTIATDLANALGVAVTVDLLQQVRGGLTLSVSALGEPA